MEQGAKGFFYQERKKIAAQVRIGSGQALASHL